MVVTMIQICIHIWLRQRARFCFASTGCRASVAAAARVLAGSLLQEWRQQAGSHTATHVLLRGSQSKFRSVARRQPVGSGSAAKAGQPVNWLPSHFSPAAGRLQPSGSHSFFAGPSSPPSMVTTGYTGYYRYPNNSAFN